ncbi:MAG: sugar ABC transporter permease [Clostridia bacterium]|nr:sugar ABC transporter permease [Clostridia bacterium]
MNNQKPKKSLVRRHDNFGFVFLIPWMIGFTVFFLYPFLRSVLLSVQKVEFLPGGGFSTTFVGIENYITALTRDEKFLPLAAGSVLDLFINVPVCLVFSFFVAVLLRQKFFGNALVKAVFFLPVILGTGVFLSVQTETAAVSGMSLDSAMEEGVASLETLQSMNILNLLQDIGIPASITEYIAGPVEQIYSVISLSGVQIFIFLAGLNSIPPSVYEAAYIEGASGWVAFWKITFPMVSPIIIVNVVYSLIDNFTMSTNETMGYIFDAAFSNFDYGLSNAMAWLYCLVLAIFVGLSVALISKKVVYQS